MKLILCEIILLLGFGDITFTSDLGKMFSITLLQSKLRETIGINVAGGVKGIYPIYILPAQTW